MEAYHSHQKYIVLSGLNWLKEILKIERDTFPLLDRNQTKETLFDLKLKPFDMLLKPIKAVPKFENDDESEETKEEESKHQDQRERGSLKMALTYSWDSRDLSQTLRNKARGVREGS